MPPRLKNFLEQEEALYVYCTSGTNWPEENNDETAVENLPQQQEAAAPQPQPFAPPSPPPPPQPQNIFRNLQSHNSNNNDSNDITDVTNMEPGAPLPDSLFVPSLDPQDAGPTLQYNPLFDMAAPQEQPQQQQGGSSLPSLLLASQALLNENEHDDEDEDSELVEGSELVEEGDHEVPLQHSPFLSPHQQQQQQEQQHMQQHDAQAHHDLLRLQHGTTFDEEEEESDIEPDLDSSHHQAQDPLWTHSPGPARISSLSMSRGVSQPLFLDPRTTTFHDLQALAVTHCTLLDIMAEIERTRSPTLLQVGMRLLADYARHSVHLFFASPALLPVLVRALLTMDYETQELAAQVLRSLSTHEIMDPLLLAPGAKVLPTLAFVAQGGGHLASVFSGGISLPTNPVAAEGSSHYWPQTPAPRPSPVFQFDTPPSSDPHRTPLLAPRFTSFGADNRIIMVSELARTHACIALMNLSCGPSNKAVMARQCPPLLAAMRTVLENGNETLKLKAVTTLKNLSNLESNDVALITFPGLVHALGQIILQSTLTSDIGATSCTTNACMALMNLSISKPYKSRVYHTPGIVQSLLTVLARTSAHQDNSVAHEARVRACCVISNLAIGYDNKLSMFLYPGLVDAILDLMMESTVVPSANVNAGQVRSKACSILWSLAAEKANQVPLVQSSRVVQVLLHIASETKTAATGDARQKSVAALTLLAESPANALPLLQAGVLEPLFAILQQAGSDPTQWKEHTASWCVSCLMNLAQVDEALPALRDAGVVQLLAPLVHMDQEYQSLKAAMATTLASRMDLDSIDYSLLRKMETITPRMINLLFNTLAGRGGEGYKYGVFTLSSSVACLAALASGPEFVQERVSTTPVLVSLLQVVWDFCVDGGIPATIVGGGREDVASATWAIKALHSIVDYLQSSGNAPEVLPNLAEPLVRALKAAHVRFADFSNGTDNAQMRAMIRHTIQLIEGPSTMNLTVATANMSVVDDENRGEHQHQERKSASAPSTPITGKRKQPEASSTNSTTSEVRDGFFSPVSVAIPDLDNNDTSLMVRKPLRRRGSDPTSSESRTHSWSTMESP